MELSELIFDYCYSNEPCRICGKRIGADVSAVYAGYAKNAKTRSAHGACWDARKNDKGSWVHREDPEES